MTNRELDKWIHAEVLRQIVPTDHDINNPHCDCVPRYTESSDAFIVLDKMIEIGEVLMCSLQYDGHTKQWRLILRKYEEIIVEDFWPWANTKELAICLAVQKAIEGKK